VFCSSGKNAAESADTVPITVTYSGTDNAQQQWLSWLSWFPAVHTGVRSNPGCPRVKIRARALALAAPAPSTSTAPLGVLLCTAVETWLVPCLQDSTVCSLYCACEWFFGLWVRGFHVGSSLKMAQAAVGVGGGGVEKGFTCAAPCCVCTSRLCLCTCLSSATAVCCKCLQKQACFWH
jgi:hypothetical protein